MHGGSVCFLDFMIVIADDSKWVTSLGRFPLPIEVVPFGLAATRRAVERLAGELGLAGAIELRRSAERPFVTDEGHYILDASFGRIPDPEALSAALLTIPGVAEHGLFIGIASVAVVGRVGGVEWLSPRSSKKTSRS